MQTLTSDSAQSFLPRLLINFPEYCLLMLCWGILGGQSSSMIWISAITTVGHWFFRRARIATGLATFAGSFGGIFFPIMFKRLVQRLGWEWTIRTFGLRTILLGILAFAMMRLKAAPKPQSESGHQFPRLRNPAFTHMDMSAGQSNELASALHTDLAIRLLLEESMLPCRQGWNCVV